MLEQQPAYPKEFLEHLQSISNKRAKIVIDHILKHGFITTEDLETTYGYSHPPRAARDVRESGVPLDTFKVKSGGGKSIAAYKFGDLAALQTNRLAGRIQFSKEFKHSLYQTCNGRCQVCNGLFEERYLQVDHRVPYEVAGDTTDRNARNFMLLCGSCNRSKSWSCEHCVNWKDMKDSSICMSCYWGHPESYSHIALEQVRRLDLQWTGEEETAQYDKLKAQAIESGMDLVIFIKSFIKGNL